MDITIGKCNACGHEEEYFSQIDVWDKEEEQWKTVRRPLYKYCEECGDTDVEEIIWR